MASTTCVARTQYMETLQHQDNDIVARVRGLRNEMQVTVNTVRAARDQIAARKQELEATQQSLRQRTEELATARRKQHATLMQVRKQQDHLEGDLSEISQKIAEQLAARHGRAARRAGQGRSGHVDLAGQRAGRLGLRDRAGARFTRASTSRCPTGTQIRAAASGTVSIAGSAGGYGNYTCIDHGGGLSTCYAHQEQILVSSGQQVAQGQVIGISRLHRPLSRPPRSLRGQGERSGRGPARLSIGVRLPR